MSSLEIFMPAVRRKHAFQQANEGNIPHFTYAECGRSGAARPEKSR
jgi:hypothetical protein